MNKFLSFLENKLAPLGEKIGTQRHLRALREGNYDGNAISFNRFFLF